MTLRSVRAGFTLIEMLVALVLLSFVMLGLSSALRAFAQTETRIDQRIQRSETQRTLAAFLREIISWVPRLSMPGKDGAKPRMPLLGSANELAWIGTMPPRHGIGGLHYLHLALERRDHGMSLVLRYQPIGEKLVWPDWTTTESIDLAENLGELKFQYFGEEKDGWGTAWSSEDKLPSLVRINIAAEGSEFPDLTLRIVEGAVGEGSGGDIAIGGIR